MQLRVSAAVFALGILLLMSPAEAASFDCSKTVWKSEDVVCKTAKLSELDDAMAAAYQRARERLSGAGRTMLQAGQREWIKFIRWCEADIICLQYKYERRIQILDRTGFLIGPYKFGRHDHYLSQGGDPRSYFLSVGFPVIEDAKSISELAWNRYMERFNKLTGDCDGTAEEAIVDFEIKSASTKIISTKFDFYSYCGGAHGFGNSPTWNIVFLPEPHLLEAKEIFAPETAWLDALAFLTAVKLTEIARDRSWDWEITVEKTMSIVADPSHWSVDDKGLSVAFDTYSVEAYAFGAHDVMVPWTDLEPYLAKDGLFTPAR